MLGGGGVFPHYKEYMTTRGSIPPARISHRMRVVAISRRVMGKSPIEFPLFEQVSEEGWTMYIPLLYTKIKDSAKFIAVVAEVLDKM